METIKTKRFILRAPKVNDAGDIAKYLNNWNVVKNLSNLPFPYGKKDAEAFLKKTSGEMRKKNPANYVMYIVMEGKTIGSAGAHHIEHTHKAEMGYWLAEEFWGQGIMPQAVKAFMDHVFKKFKLKRIYARIYAQNKASMRVAEKVGMKFEGIAKKDAMKNGKYIDTHVYAKVK